MSACVRAALFLVALGCCASEALAADGVSMPEGAGGMFGWIYEPQAWVALLTLTVLEIVLGVDNIIFISILCAKLPPEERETARRIGLGLAMGARILLLLSIAWVVGLKEPLFAVMDFQVSGRDLVLLGGGLFLLAKATHEIHDSLEGEHGGQDAKVGATFRAVLFQIILLDIVFSLDSVITAVGMADHVPVMVIAVVIAVGVMMFFARALGEFVEAHPTVKMLALSFLLLIGMALVADGLHQHIPKGYIYFAMGFSVFVELLNLKMRARREAHDRVQLRRPYTASEVPGLAEDAGEGGEVAGGA